MLATIQGMFCTHHTANIKSRQFIMEQKLIRPRDWPTKATKKGGEMEPCLVQLARALMKHQKAETRQ
jgi:hypothetical protein